MRLPGPLRSLSLKLGVVVAGLVAVVMGLASYLSFRAEREQIVHLLQRSADAQGRIAELGIQYAMIFNDRALIESMIAELAEEEDVEGIMVLDAAGRVRVASRGVDLGEARGENRPGCSACHEKRSGARPTSVVLEDRNPPVLRNVVPILNGPHCYRCHPRSERLTGLLVMDFSLVQVARARDAMIRRLAWWTPLTCLAVLLAAGLAVNLLALRRVWRLRAASQAIARGDLARVVVDRGRDEIGDLAADFNAMTASLRDTLRDLTEHKRFLAALIEGMDDGILVVDEAFRIRSANRSLLARIDDPRGALVGTRCGGGDGLPCPIAGKRVDECPTRASFQTGRSQKVICARRGVDGKERYEEIQTSAIKGDEGMVLQVIEVWRDITQRSAMEANLVRSEQLAAMGVLASGFSHEINTPLGTVSVVIQGVMRELRGHASLDEGGMTGIRESLEVASREVFRCREITRKFLDASRLPRVLPGPVDLNRAVGEMVRLVLPTARGQGVVVEQSLAGNLPAFHGYQDDIERLVLNLLVNSLQAIEGAGRVVVETGASNGWVGLTVRDDGCGVDPQDIDHLFEPFFSRKPRGSGTGLGLYLCRRIAAAHAGEIRIESPEGRGAVVTATFPVAGAGSETT